jgi:protein TonB
METNKILDADLLDILFEGKNKEYGAYELRKTYNGRLVRALIVTGSVIVLLFTASFVSWHGPVKPQLFITDSVTLSAVNDRVEPPVIPPPKPHVEMPRVATLRDVTPRIVPDPQANEAPPENKDLDNVKIGDQNVAGTADVGLDAPTAPPGTGTGVIETPPAPDNDDRIFRKVEIESSYPGGPGAWLRFLNKNLSVPDGAIDAPGEVKITARFIVDRDGNVSDIEIADGPDNAALRNEIIRVIKKSGKWTPAQQNGRFVKSYKMQPVTFRLSE